MKVDLSEFGFREDFDWETRFDLKTRVKCKGKIYEISTVDLGLDHSFGIGKPLYYETMIFLVDDSLDLFERNEKNEFSGFQVRYSTEKEARKGHKEAIEYVKQLKGGVTNE